MIYLELFDGHSRVKAVEILPLVSKDFSTFINPGCKILILGPIRHLRETFLLTPRNCQLLGGDVEELMATNRPVHLMAKILNKPVPESEKKKEQEILTNMYGFIKDYGRFFI